MNRQHERAGELKEYLHTNKEMPSIDQNDRLDKITINDDVTTNGRRATEEVTDDVDGGRTLQKEFFINNIENIPCVYSDRDRRLPPVISDGLLPPEYFLEAEQDVHEKQEWIERDVQALRELVEREEGLNARTDTAFLLTFLRARKFDYDKAAAMLVSYYRTRQVNAPLYVDLTPADLTAVWRCQLQTVLPTPDRLGRTVLLFRAGHWDPTSVTLDDVYRSQVLLLEHVVRRPLTQLKGVAAVVECGGLGRIHACSLSPSHLKRMMALVQEVFPLRFKALHFVNEPAMFEWVFSAVRPLLSDTIKSRLHFHGSNYESLHRHIDPAHLPQEFGGHGPPLDNRELVNVLNGEEQYFRDHFSYGYAAQQPFVLPKSSVSMSSLKSLGYGDPVTEDLDRLSCRDPSPQSSRQSFIGSVADVGSLIGSYYRRMCIE